MVNSLLFRIMHIRDNDLLLSLVVTKLHVHNQEGGAGQDRVQSRWGRFPVVLVMHLTMLYL